MVTLEVIKNRAYMLGQKIDVERDSTLYPQFLEDENLRGEGASIHVNDTLYHYTIMERGKVVKEYESKDLDEILFQLFYDITFDMACKYELEHRNENEDFRRILFTKQLELLQAISNPYYEKGKQRIDEVLGRVPYRDRIA